MSDAIYFVHPKSVPRMCADFRDDDPIEFDQYGTVHIGFCVPCPEEEMDLIAKCGKLAARVASL
jgi:hypothetical protein